MIRLERVCLSFPGFGLRDINIHVEKGMHLFLVGPSGSGKTLLLETIAGLHRHASGRVIVNGRDITSLPPESRGIGLLYQDYALFPHMTVRENVEFGLRAHDHPESYRKERSGSLLSTFGLVSFCDRYPGTLSGGEQQRVALARAIAAGHEILLLDEPFAAIDPELRSRFFEEFTELIHKNALTVIQVSHSREEAYALADTMAVIMDGEIVQAGTREEVFSHPETPAIARFLGFENLLPCIPTDLGSGKTSLKSGNCEFYVTERIAQKTPLIACIRASDIRICPDNPPPDDKLSPNKGIITGIVEEEHGVKVLLDCGVPMVARLSWNEQSNLRVYRGQPITLSISPDSIHLVSHTPDGEKSDSAHPSTQVLKRKMEKQ